MLTFQLRLKSSSSPTEFNIVGSTTVKEGRWRSHTAARDLHWAADNDSRQRLRSSATHKLIVPRTRCRRRFV